ncbi:MAG: hypothetical protein J0L82_18450 [Deltaproteobacteria bacterium]|nr:hypothetical protein [Deltaproteobacteria bacterium]
MAYQTLSTAEWLLSKRTELDVKFLEFNWGNAHGVPLFDFEVSLLGRHIGRGTSFDQELAFEKAAAEALERLVCFENRISTEGVAAHPSPEAANRNAILEALERHLFNEHLATKQPFTLAKPAPATFGLKAAIENLGATVAWMKMRRVAGYESSVCLIQKEDRRFLGLGFGEDAADVQTHAAIEALRNLAAYCEAPVEFVEQTKSNSDLWSCSSDFFAKHEDVFRGSANTIEQDHFKNLPISIRHLESTTLPELPLSFVQARVAGGAL